MSVRVNIDSGMIDRGGYIALRFNFTSLKATGNLRLFHCGSGVPQRGMAATSGAAKRPRRQASKRIVTVWEGKRGQFVRCQFRCAGEGRCTLMVLTSREHAGIEV
jgi:hypothetical protein